jgi:hypothetical protein
MKRLGSFVLIALMSIVLTGSAAAHVALDYPVGGETFLVGETVEIQWHVVIPHDQENWDLYWSSDGGTTWETLELDLPVEQLSYLWTLPDVVTEQGRVRIYMDNTGTDYEDSSGDFAIQAGAPATDPHGNSAESPALHVSHPNPFTKSATVSYALPAAAAVDLAIYDRSGQRLRTLVSGQRSAGTHSIEWDGLDQTGSQLPSGSYVCRLALGSSAETRGIVLLR